MNIRKRLLSFIICGVMALSACPLTAFAGDGETGDAIVEETECICETLCDEENINENCPVCSENWENCEGEEPECEYEILCTEEEVNDDCPVCSAEGAELDKVCVDAALLLAAPTLRTGEIELYVAGQRITESGCYANQEGTWTKFEGTGPSRGQFYYDAATATLTLNQAEITHDQTVTVAEGYTYEGSVIAYSPSADVSLNIVVSQGTSTITGKGGIRVESTTGNASLSIKGPGSLDVEPKGSNSGITLCSSKNTNLNIDGADVTASSPSLYGVYLLSDTATSTSTITVNNGSLTTGGNGNVGIYYYWPVTNNAGTSSLTVSGNAVVDTRNSKILTNNEETGVQVGAGGDGNGGIVFDGKSGTVYGDVELREDLEIGEGESLTIGKDASLTVPDGKTLTNNGTINVESGGTLTGEPGGNVVYAPTITTQPKNVEVKENETATFTVNAAGTEPLSYQWQKITDNGSSWMDITGETNATYTIATTTTDMSGTQYRCVVKNSIDEVTSDAATLTVSPKQYAVTVQTDGNGTASASTTAAAAGTEITLTATPDSGYHFERWEVVSGTITIQNDKFIMPAENVTVKAVFDRNSSGGGGSYSLPEGIDRDEPKDEPEEQPEYRPDEPSTPGTTGFIDVSIFDWYYDGVMYATENGIMNGVGGNRFEPETELKREMLAVILWNMTDNPEPNGIAPFLDVTSDKYYAKAIAWANENGVMYGYGEEFGVGEAVTREDFAAILYRYAAFKGYDTTQGGMAIREFIDFEQIADYAVEALGWAVNSGIISGMGDGTVSPKTSTYRGQAAVMLMKFCENIMK